jgi:hypothetical protein
MQNALTAELQPKAGTVPTCTLGSEPYSPGSGLPPLPGEPNEPIGMQPEPTTEHLRLAILAAAQEGDL